MNFSKALWKFVWLFTYFVTVVNLNFFVCFDWHSFRTISGWEILQNAWMNNVLHWKFERKCTYLSHIRLSVLLDWEKHRYYQLELQTFTKHLSFSRNYMSISIFYRVILCKIKGKFWSLKSTVCFWKLVRKYIVILKSFALLVSLLQKLILFKHFICCTKKQKKFFFIRSF